MSHLEKYKFEWEDTELAFKYSVELSSDKSKLIKKFWMQKGMKRKLVLDEQRIWNVTLTDPSKPLENKFVVRSKMPAHFWNDSVPKAFFGIRTATQVKYFTAITKGQKNTYITYNSNWLIKNNAGGEFYRTLPTIWQLLIQHQVIKQHFKSRKLIICLFQKFFMKKKMKILSENLSL